MAHKNTIIIVLVVVIIIIIILNAFKLPLFTINVDIFSRNRSNHKRKSLRGRSKSKSKSPRGKRSKSSSRSTNSRSRSRSSSKNRHNHERHSKEKNLDVRTVCLDLNISPQFHCNGGLVDISTSVSGGIKPYFYKWQNGSTSPNLIGVPFGEAVTLTVMDVRGCKTTIKLTAPESLECHV